MVTDYEVGLAVVVAPAAVVTGAAATGVVVQTVLPPPALQAVAVTATAAAAATSAVGFMVALLGGPIGLVVGGAIGAGAGAVAAKVVDLGIPDEWVDWLKEATEPGRTVLALLVASLDRDALVAELERFHGARLLYGNLS